MCFIETPVCDCNVLHGDALLEAREGMPDAELLVGLSDFFKVLGDGTRTKIVCALDKRELCVCDLASLLNMTKSAISHQLAYLKNAKLVKFRRDGKNVFYSLDDGHVKQIVDLTIEHLTHE